MLCCMVLVQCCGMHWSESQPQLLQMRQGCNSVCRPGCQQGALGSLVLLGMPQLPLHKQSWRVVDLHESTHRSAHTIMPRNRTLHDYPDLTAAHPADLWPQAPWRRLWSQNAPEGIGVCPRQQL